MKEREERSGVPVALFCYNRPHHLRQTLSALAASNGAREAPLWLFCDGTRSVLEVESVEAVRTIARDPELERRFASVVVVEAERNKGLARSIIEGVSRVLESAESVIVLEDDLLVAPDFLRFMKDCLEFYREDSQVGSVTGFSPFAEPPPGYAEDVMAVPRNCSHGWATWSDRWARVDWNACDAPRLWREPKLRRRFHAAGSERLGRLRRQLLGQSDSWSILFGLWQTLEGRHTIYPVINRVRNIGFDGSGIHTRSGQEVNSRLPSAARGYRLSHPSYDGAILSRFREIYSGGFWRRTLRSLELILRGPPRRRLENGPMA